MCGKDAENIQPGPENSASARGSVWLVGNCTERNWINTDSKCNIWQMHGSHQVTFFSHHCNRKHTTHRHFLLIERLAAVCSQSSQFDDRPTREGEKRTVSFSMECSCMLHCPLCFAPFSRVRMQQVSMCNSGNVKFLFIAARQVMGLSRTCTNI